MQEPPLVFRYPTGRLLAGLALSGAFAIIGLAICLGDDPSHWGGFLFVAIGLAGLAQFGSSLIARDRWGSLRVDADGFVYRLGIWSRQAKFLECAPFHFVDYIGPDCVTWRRWSVERALSPEQASRAPDPSDSDGHYLELPSAMGAEIGGVQALCDLLNQRRCAAFAAAGQTADVQPTPTTSSSVARATEGGFLSPPAVPRALFIAFYMYINPALVFLAFYFHDKVAAAITLVLTPFCRLIFGPASEPKFLVDFLTVPIIIAVFLVWTTWLAAGRLKDLGEPAGCWRAFFHAFLSGRMKRRKLVGRKGIGQ